MKSAVIVVVMWTYALTSVSAFTTITIPFQPKQYAQFTPRPRTKSCRRIRKRSGEILFALAPFQWFFRTEDADDDAATEFTGKSAKEAEVMHRTAKMMEDHRRSQEAAERTAAMMKELSSNLIVGKSKAGAGGGIGIGGGNNRRGGVKVTFDGEQRPVGVEVDPNFLFSSSKGVIAIEELNKAIMDAMDDGYEQSGTLMEEKIKGLYVQLGLPREPPPLPSGSGGDTMN